MPGGGYVDPRANYQRNRGRINRPARTGVSGGVVPGSTRPANPGGVPVVTPPPAPVYAPGGVNAPGPVVQPPKPSQADIDRYNQAIAGGPGTAGAIMNDPAMQNVDRYLQATGQGAGGTPTGTTTPTATAGPQPGTTPAAPGQSPQDQWQSMIERFLPVDVPGGAATLFPEWDPRYEDQYTKATGTAADYTTATPGEYDTLSNYLTNNLGRLGGPGTTNAAYDEQLQRWMESSQFEEGRQAAGMREMMGSRGARYGSDIMSAEGQMRNEFGARTRAEAGAIADRLNQARLQELGITVPGLQNVGRGRADIAEAGMQRGYGAAESAAQRGASLTTAERQHMFDAMMRRQEAAGGAYASAQNLAWQEYLLSRLPPDMVQQMLGYSTSFNPPGSVVQ